MKVEAREKRELEKDSVRPSSLISGEVANNHQRCSTWPSPPRTCGRRLRPLSIDDWRRLGPTCLAVTGTKGKPRSRSTRGEEERKKFSKSTFDVHLTVGSIGPLNEPGCIEISNCRLQKSPFKRIIRGKKMAMSRNGVSHSSYELSNLGMARS